MNDLPNTKEVKESWDYIWNKRFEKTYATPTYELVWKTVESYIPRKGIVLDAGCGDGEYSRKIMKITPSVVSMDLSSAALKSLKEEGNLTLVGDAGNLPLKSQFSNAVISLSVLEYVEDPKRAIMEFERVLKPGGYLIITVPNLTSLYTIQRKLRIMLGRYIYYRNIILYSRDSLHALFKGTKFKIETHDYDVLYFNILNKIFGKEIGSRIILRIKQILPEFLRSNFSHYIICVARKS